MDPLFFELHRDLPHEAPGSRTDTLRALALTGRAGPLRILDIACGPGAASLALLEALPAARVTAIDAHAPFVVEAEARVAAAGHAARFAARTADMGALPFPPGAFDLLWCEGAIYLLGVGEALRRWRRLLAPGGRLAFTDAVWLTPEPHPESRAVFADYPAMTDLAGLREAVAAAGWRRRGDFLLSEAAWANYYGPLEARRAALAARHGADHPVLAEAAREIALRREHGGDYGYAFLVAAPA